MEIDKQTGVWWGVHVVPGCLTANGCRRKGVSESFYMFLQSSYKPHSQPGEIERDNKEQLLSSGFLVFIVLTREYCAFERLMLVFQVLFSHFHWTVTNRQWPVSTTVSAWSLPSVLTSLGGSWVLYTSKHINHPPPIFFLFYYIPLLSLSFLVTLSCRYAKQ